MRIFHPFAEKPPWTDLHEILHRGSSHRRSQPCQILSQSDQAFRFCGGSNFWLEHQFSLRGVVLAWFASYLTGSYLMAVICRPWSVSRVRSLKVQFLDLDFRPLYGGPHGCVADIGLWMAADESCHNRVAVGKLQAQHHDVGQGWSYPAARLRHCELQRSCTSTRSDHFVGSDPREARFEDLLSWLLMASPTSSHPAIARLWIGSNSRACFRDVTR